MTHAGTVAFFPASHLALVHGPASVLGDEKFRAMGPTLGPKSGPAIFSASPKLTVGLCLTQGNRSREYKLGVGLSVVIEDAG